MGAPSRNRLLYLEERKIEMVVVGACILQANVRWH